MRGAIAGLLAGALALTMTGGTVDATVRQRQVGGSDRYVVDMTPDGRFMLLGHIDGGAPVRVDRRTGGRRTLPFVGELSANGGHVFGINPATDRLTRFTVSTGRRATYALPSEWIPTDVSIDDNGSRIGVIAVNAVRGQTGAFLVNASTRNVRRIDTLVPGRRARTGGLGQLVISADGSVMVFHEAHVTGGAVDVFAYRNGAVSLVSRDVRGRRTDTGDSYSQDVSGNGRFVLFWSNEKNLVRGITTSKPRFYLRDLERRTTVRVSIPASTRSGPGDVAASINHDGSRIAFPLDGAVIVNGTRRAGTVVGHFNRGTRRVTKVIKTRDGGPPRANGLSPLGSLTIDAFGVQVGFSSSATNLVNSSGRGQRSYVSTLS